MGVGFFFSLGHSTIVFSLAAGLAIAAATVDSQIPAFQDYGGTLGATVSGTFLWVIGIINLLVLVDIVRIFLSMRRGTYDAEQLERRLQDRGLMNRLYLGRLPRGSTPSWKMYPLGMLFGLGSTPPPRSDCWPCRPEWQRITSRSRPCFRCRSCSPPACR